MTLIEVLITIVVFTSGILVILSVITNSLSLGRRSRNRTNATMLAKEWLEMMYNIRDTNLDRAQPRDCVPPINNNTCAYYLSDVSSGTIFTIEVTWANNIVISAWLTSRLYITTWSNGNIVYTHSITSQPSPFYRTIIISDAQLPGDTIVINNNIKKITSRIQYPQLWGTGEVMLESFIWLTRE